MHWWSRLLGFTLPLSDYAADREERELCQEPASAGRVAGETGKGEFASIADRDVTLPGLSHLPTPDRPPAGPLPSLP